MYQSNLYIILYVKKDVSGIIKSWRKNPMHRYFRLIKNTWE